MLKKETSEFGKPMNILYPGDFFATKDDIILSTVTGACVVICLSDPMLKIGGMGHFIVPESKGTEGIISDEIAHQGIVKIEYLMAEIIKLGGDRKNLNAKIFGAGYTDYDKSSFDNLSESNIRFLQEYFTLEKIEIRRSDLGGDFRRKIHFSLNDGKVFRQILKNNEESSEFIKLEKEYIDVEFRNKTKTGRVLLFE